MKRYALPAFLDLNVAPGRLVWRAGALAQLAELVAVHGDAAGVVATDGALARANPHFGPARLLRHRFSGAITADTIARATDDLYGCDVVVGIGGGKALDCAKAAAYDLRKPCLAVPTSAATCAALTALVVVYDAAGRFAEYRYVTTPPAVTLCEPALIAAAPDRLLAAGLADGVAKWVETVSSAGREPEDHFGVWSLDAAARALDLYGKTCAAGIPADPAERAAVAFASLVLSGLSSGIGGMTSFATIAHALANGLTRAVPEPDRLLHGEWIAACLLVEMRLEGFPPAETERLTGLFRAVGLPVTRADLAARLGAPIDESAWRAAYDHAVSDGETAELARTRFGFQDLLTVLL